EAAFAHVDEIRFDGIDHDPRRLGQSVLDDHDNLPHRTTVGAAVAALSQGNRMRVDGVDFPGRRYSATFIGRRA
ncbi:MAG: hypothetical protein JNL71_17490, partial [Rhodospirillales bacterium]|nr:hypothetical protein [Rhodospirillales bacterium]